MLTIYDQLPSVRVGTLIYLDDITTYRSILFTFTSSLSVVIWIQNSDQKKNDSCECVKLSLFLEYMNNVTKELKLQTLISESKDWAVLGISYSTMVCDNQCLETYLPSLRDFHHLHIIKASSIPTYTFKASKTFHQCLTLMLKCVSKCW